MVSQETETLGLFETTVPINKTVINSFAKEPTILYVKDDNGAVYISNGYFALKTNQKIFDDLIAQVNSRKRTSDIETKEMPRLLEIVNKAKGTFELSQKPHELEMRKNCTAYFYADNKQYFGYNKKYVDFFIKSVTRLFVDDNAGYDLSSHSLVAKNRRNEVLGIVLPLTVPDVLYEKLADILPLEIKWKNELERIKENLAKDPYIGKEFSNSNGNLIISAVKKYNGAPMYVVRKIENGKLLGGGDLIKVDEIKEHIARWEAYTAKKPGVKEQMANAAKQAAADNAARPAPDKIRKKKTLKNKEGTTI